MPRAAATAAPSWTSRRPRTELYPHHIPVPPPHGRVDEAAPFTGGRPPFL